MPPYAFALSHTPSTRRSPCRSRNVRPKTRRLATFMNNAQHHMGWYDLGILCEDGFKFLGGLIRLARDVVDQA